MDTIVFYIKLGFQHVIDFNGLDHFYFIIALSLPYGFKQAKKLLWWVTLFTLGHTFSLIGNYYADFAFSSYWIELLIPITIALSCLPIIAQNPPKIKWFSSVLTFVFGIVHGLGFGRFFAMMVTPNTTFIPLLSFAMGVELAQILIVVFVLLSHLFVQKHPKGLNYWRFGLGGFIFLMALVMIIERI